MGEQFESHAYVEIIYDILDDAGKMYDIAYKLPDGTLFKEKADKLEDTFTITKKELKVEEKKEVKETVKEEKPAKKETKKEEKKEAKEDLSSKTLTKEKGIKGYSTMKKADLVAALQ